MLTRPCIRMVVVASLGLFGAYGCGKQNYAVKTDQAADYGSAYLGLKNLLANPVLKQAAWRGLKMLGGNKVNWLGSTFVSPKKELSPGIDRHKPCTSCGTIEHFLNSNGQVLGQVSEADLDFLSVVALSYEGDDQVALAKLPWSVSASALNASVTIMSLNFVQAANSNSAGLALAEAPDDRGDAGPDDSSGSDSGDSDASDSVNLAVNGDDVTLASGTGVFKISAVAGKAASAALSAALSATSQFFATPVMQELHRRVVPGTAGAVIGAAYTEAKVSGHDATVAGGQATPASARRHTDK